MTATQVIPFEAAWAFAETAKGWLEREEAALLYDLARNAADIGRIVELGSYCGRSSIVLAAALIESPDARLVCVDTFGGSAEHQPGGAYFDAQTIVDGRVDTYPTFRRNLRRAGLLDRVDAMRAMSRVAAAAVAEPISLLFIDADHSYAGVCADVDAWAPKLVGTGWIVLHDVGDWAGATRAAADLLDAGYTRHTQAGTALALRKPAEA